MNRQFMFQTSRGRTTLPVLIALFGVLSATGCEHGPAVDYPSEIEKLAVRHDRPAPLAAAQMRGQKTYLHYCQICHGADGQGNGFNATGLASPPRDFSDSEFWKKAEDDRLTMAISAGGAAVGKSVLMPAWGQTLGKKQIQDLLAYLRSVPELVEKNKQAAADEAAADEEEEEEGLPEDDDSPAEEN